MMSARQDARSPRGSPASGRSGARAHRTTAAGVSGWPVGVRRGGARWCPGGRHGWCPRAGVGRRGRSAAGHRCLTQSGLVARPVAGVRRLEAEPIEPEGAPRPDPRRRWAAGRRSRDEPGPTPDSPDSRIRRRSRNGISRSDSPSSQSRSMATKVTVSSGPNVRAARSALFRWVASSARLRRTPSRVRPASWPADGMSSIADVHATSVARGQLGQEAVYDEMLRPWRHRPARHGSRRCPSIGSPASSTRVALRVHDSPDRSSPARGFRSTAAR